MRINIALNGCRYSVSPSEEKAWVIKSRRGGGDYLQQITSAPKLRRLMKLAAQDGAVAEAPELSTSSAPTTDASAEPGPETENVQMRTKTGSRARTVEGPRPGTKLAKIVSMLKRPSGCTAAEVMKACEWPSVSMPQQAKAAGVKLKKEKVDGVTRYRAAS